MKALFLESKAAAQVREHIRVDGGDLEELLDVAYNNGAEYFQFKKDHDYRSVADVESYDDWWIGLCLRDDRHKAVDINGLMEWVRTKQGAMFWSRVQMRLGAEQ